MEIKQESQRVRQYTLRSSSKCNLECSYCHFVGMKSQEDKTEQSLKIGLEKATTGRNRNLILPCNTLFSPLLKSIKNNPSPIKKSWVLHCQYTQEIWQKALSQIQQSTDEVYFWLDLWTPSTPRKLQQLQKQCYKIVIPLIPNIDLHTILQGLKDTDINSNLIFSYAPININNNNNLLSPVNINSLIESALEKYPWFKFQTMPGWDPYNFSVPDHLEIDSLYKPHFSQENSNPKKIVISVIIPTYNNKDYLSNVVEHLCLQNYPKEKYEIIIVDDGSTDGTFTTIKNQLKSKDTNYKYIFFPRKKTREMGDRQYRAGLARNLGVQNASGNIYSFLDSDIIVPPHYLQEVEKQLEKYDILQARRFDLLETSSYRWTRYDQLSIEEDTSTKNMGYWECFNLKTQNWQKLHHHWKYACTHSLSLKASLFDQAGWFRRNYNIYGYEDVELGYKLYQLKAHFHLLEMPVYHLFHQTARSEFQNSDLERRHILSQSAGIFFCNTLSKDVFDHINFYFQKSNNYLYNLPILKPIRRLFEAYIYWCNSQ